MSDALEALEKLRENVRHPAGIEFGGLRDNEETRTAIVALMEFVSAALEQREAVAIPAKRLPDDGCGDEDAYNAGWNDCRSAMLNTAPPSMAEAQARALDEMAGEIYQRSLGDDMSESSKDMMCYASGMVRLKAKRIREEGNE